MILLVSRASAVRAFAKGTGAIYLIPALRSIIELLIAFAVTEIAVTIAMAETTGFKERIRVRLRIYISFAVDCKAWVLIKTKFRMR